MRMLCPKSIKGKHSLLLLDYKLCLWWFQQQYILLLFQSYFNLLLGHGKIAASASIPSKYQTIVISNDEKKGFNSGSKRFNHISEFTESPGPAKYSLIQPLLKENHESHSKKGLGGFVSKVKRFPRRLNEGYSVGPGQYNPSVDLNHDFNKAKCTSNFHKPIAVNNNSKKFQTPAPNHYSVSIVLIFEISFHNSTS